MGDYNVTVNSMLNVDQFPLTNPEEPFVTLSSGQKYSKLDITQTYQYILLDEESRELVAINTHIDQPVLHLGLPLATSIFQKSIEGILKGFPWWL